MREQYSALLRSAVVAKVAHGAHIVDMSRDLGIPLGTIRTWCEQAGVTRPPDGMTEDVVRAARELWARGWTSTAIADALGVPHTTLTTHISRHRDEFPYRRRAIQ